MSKRNYFLCIMCVLICIFAPILHTEFKESELPRLYNKVSPACVWIGAEYSDADYYHYESWGRNKIKWQGTGFIISSDGLIATAGHMVEDTETFQLIFSDGRKGRAKFVYIEDSENCDAGFIQITWIQRRGFHILDIISYTIIGKIPLSDPIKRLPHVKLTDKITIAEELAIIGYPWGLQDGLTITQGIVSALDRNIPFFGEKFMVHTDTASWPGNSGSAVFNMNGDVVGILVGGMYGADSFSLCTPAKIVILALNKYKAIEAMRVAK